MLHGSTRNREKAPETMLQLKPRMLLAQALNTSGNQNHASNDSFDSLSAASEIIRCVKDNLVL